MEDAPDLDSLLDGAETEAATSRRRCATCRRYPDLLPLISQAFASKAAGRDIPSVVIYRRLCRKAGYGLHESAFRNHVTRCLGREYDTGELGG